MAVFWLLPSKKNRNLWWSNKLSTPRKSVRRLLNRAYLDIEPFDYTSHCSLTWVLEWRQVDPPIVRWTKLSVPMRRIPNIFQAVQEINQSSQKQIKVACGILYRSLQTAVSSIQIRVPVPRIRVSRLRRNRKKKESGYRANKYGERTHYNH